MWIITEIPDEYYHLFCAEFGQREGLDAHLIAEPPNHIMKRLFDSVYTALIKRIELQKYERTG